MDIGIKVLSNFYPSDDDGVNKSDEDYAECSSQTVLASYSQGRGRQPALHPIPNDNEGIGSNINSIDDAHLMWQRSRGDLPFTETHYAVSDSADDNGRLFKSLELGNGSASSFDDQVENWHHHSMDDLVKLSLHHRIKSASGVSKGVAPVSDSQRGRANEKEDEDDIETVKNLFLSAWINTKNGWLIQTNTNFKRDSPIWLLGQVYHCSQDEKNKGGHRQRLSPDNATTQFEKFKIDFKSRLWFTYRKDFPTLPESHLKSDAGWGCMMRCGQMLLAQALLVHLQSREWTWNPRGDETIHRQIIRYFGDVPHRISPFSIHKLVEIGISQLGKKPGDWYGPASIAHTLRQALQNAQQYDSQLNELALYVARDGVVYVEDVLDEYQSERPQPVSAAALSSTAQVASRERAMILVVPMRLGGETINETHIPCLKTMLNTKQCIGIIGGKPKHSMYFMGWQDDKLICLDPHCCQDFVDITPQHFPLSTFHCTSPRKLAFSKMDPSCAIGFYCRTRSELNALLQEIPKIVATPLNQNSPMFQVVGGRYADVELMADRLYVVTSSVKRASMRNGQLNGGKEDFTLL